MLRKILSTTALVAVISTGAAYAQDSTNQDMNKEPAAQTDMGNQGTGMDPVFPDMQATEDGSDFFSSNDKQVLASSLLGWPVYGPGADDQGREQVGDINDIVMNPDGVANAAVIGVGGFLGIGEKAVAVSFDRLSWEPGEDGDDLLTIDATREELENAPEFDTDGANMMEVGTADTNADMDNQDMAATTGTGTTTDMGTTGTDMASTNDGSMAMDPTEGMSPVAIDQVSFDELVGSPVLSADGDSVGEVSEVVSHGDQNEQVLIVDVGGFLGLGEKPVAISANAAEIMSDGDTYVIKTTYDRETLENQQAYTEQDLNENPEAVLLN
ncbi:PRC-barrel domain-containing protein [Martelella endophytica]|uniref:PRC-barrel domain-containing protein n=1 Tax=Martelella endophytica TaxID=1486262 RepID=A0A0D5LN22_MAREN|nr:PRC-barrel domain-containing protein [Martelella endophytica]AJY45619.1 hypothetical protein TM49_07935 [Martelella endophytica]